MSKIIRIIYYVILLLFLLDIFDRFQTKLSFFKSFIYYGVLLLSVPVLILEFKVKNKSEPILRKAIPILTIIGILYLNPLNILFHTQPWITQQVELINKKHENHKVEFQKKDMGALGYAKRNAEVYYFTKYFYFVLSQEYDDRNFIGINWKTVDSKK